MLTRTGGGGRGWTAQGRDGPSLRASMFRWKATLAGTTPRVPCSRRFTEPSDWSTSLLASRALPLPCHSGPVASCAPGWPQPLPRLSCREWVALAPGCRVMKSRTRLGRRTGTPNSITSPIFSSVAHTWHPYLVWRMCRALTLPATRDTRVQRLFRWPETGLTRS